MSHGVPYVTQELLSEFRRRSHVSRLFRPSLIGYVRSAWSGQSGVRRVGPVPPAWPSPAPISAMTKLSATCRLKPCSRSFGLVTRGQENKVDMLAKTPCPPSAYFAVFAMESNMIWICNSATNYRLYPTQGQRGALARAFGCARVVFNDAPRARQEVNVRG